MVHDRPEPAHRAATRQERRAGGRTGHRAVEVGEHQHAGRFAEVVHPRDRLLPAVAALVQVHRGADPPDLVRDGPLIGVDAQAGPQSGDPVGFVCPDAGRTDPRSRQPFAPCRQPLAGHHGIERDGRPVRVGRHSPEESAAREWRRDEFVWQRVESERVEHLLVGQRRTEKRQDAVVGGVGHHVGPEHHPLEVSQQRLRAPRLGVEKADTAQFGLDPMVFDAPLPVQAEILDCRTVGEVRDVLRRNVVQPRQPLRTRQRDHTAV